MRLLRYERTLTPAVVNYLTTIDDEDALLGAFDGLLRSRAYLNGWQTWWVQQPLSRSPGFATKPGARTRLTWTGRALVSAEHTPTLRAAVAFTLARHKKLTLDDVLSMYHRSSTTVRPVLVAAAAMLAPSSAVEKALKRDSRLHGWVYDWASNFS
jgi:hypothetical protein